MTSKAADSTIKNLVISLAGNAKEAGLDGVVASVQETRLLREEFGNDLIIVTPGIRPKDAELGDQKRVATPEEAARAGSDYIVVGRPIIEAKSPLLAAQGILNSLK